MSISGFKIVSGLNTRPRFRSSTPSKLFASNFSQKKFWRPWYSPLERAVILTNHRTCSAGAMITKALLSQTPNISLSLALIKTLWMSIVSVLELICWGFPMSFRLNMIATDLCGQKVVSYSLIRSDFHDIEWAQRCIMQLVEMSNAIPRLFCWQAFIVQRLHTLNIELETTSNIFEQLLSFYSFHWKFRNFSFK